jgi:Mlc titration factor MtfA (ptsG expression regulator)
LCDILLALSSIFSRMFFQSRSRRRKRILSEPISQERRDVLAHHVRHYKYLDDKRRSLLEGFVQVVIAEKDWAGGSGFELTDLMKVTIAGYAGVMTLGLPEPYYFDRLKTIIVYAAGYLPKRSSFDQYPEFTPVGPRLGESWHRGPVVISWQEIDHHERMRPGNNLVIHEFAHHVDGLDGDVDGTPPFRNRQQGRTWYRVTEKEFERLTSDAQQGNATLLDHYGASNRAEFFAVASECFFERPRAMRETYPELYRVLADFYCQEVADWLPDWEDPRKKQ